MATESPTYAAIMLILDKLYGSVTIGFQLLLQVYLAVLLYKK
jgi:hypothetical protein